MTPAGTPGASGGGPAVPTHPGPEDRPDPSTVAPHDSDAALLAAHVAGDPDAFGLLVRRHRDRLWAVALRTTGDREDASDALQDGLVSAFRRAGTFRGDAQVTTWLHRIVVNACLDRMRRRRTRPTEALPEDEDRAAALAVGAADDPAEVSERRADVMAALAQLPEEQRAALVLVDMEGYSVDDAAAILGCAPGTVKSRCSRGRARLVPLLTQYRRTPSPGGDARSSSVRNVADRSRNRHGPPDVQPTSAPARSEPGVGPPRRDPPPPEQEGSNP